MYCCHCGKELVEGSKYCIFCGKPCGERHDGEIQSECNSGSSQSGIPCPFCASQNTHPIVHTSTQAYSGGYSCLGGACGGILFGPIGLLLGLCGKSSTVQTSSQTKWVCKNCGAEFSSKQDEEKRLRFLLSSAFVMIIVTYVLTSIGFLAAQVAISSACFTLSLAFFMFSLIAWYPCRKGSCYQVEDLFDAEELASLDRKYTVTKFMFLGWIPYIFALFFIVSLLHGVL